MVMLIYLDHAWKARCAGGRRPTTQDLREAMVEGGGGTGSAETGDRIRDHAGLIPILWSAGTGASVMKRIAAPMVGGMISSTLLTLMVIPAVDALWKERSITKTTVTIDS